LVLAKWQGYCCWADSGRDDEGSRIAGAPCRRPAGTTPTTARPIHHLPGHGESQPDDELTRSDAATPVENEPAPGPETPGGSNAETSDSFTFLGREMMVRAWLSLRL